MCRNLRLRYSGCFAPGLSPCRSIRHSRHASCAIVLADSGRRRIDRGGRAAGPAGRGRPGSARSRRTGTRSIRTSIEGARPFADLLLGGPRPERPTGGEDLAVLLYTSGTAGAPRAAMLTHRALIANHRQVERVDPPIVARGDVRAARPAAVPRVRAQRRAGRDRLARRLRRTGGPVRPGRDPARHRGGAGQRGHRGAADVRGLDVAARPGRRASRRSGWRSAGPHRSAPRPLSGSSPRPGSASSRGTG